ncbi:hypothetical protein BHM03_00028336 [Ensete ventricosum]|uniref:Uncharacterized protein n=1 Tax=Ensete ventricosum TaxID=4639 RepID=A0A445MHX5_ENSVE|nr:hypothetical protein BHM03_00028336 [Ensete ventricosum]
MALQIAYLQEAALRTPVVMRWTSLATDSKIWSDGLGALEYFRGVLYPLLVKQIYYSPSEVLIDGTTKNLVI